MKIIQIHNYYSTPGGECRVVEAEAELLSQHGHDVVPFSRDSQHIGDMPLPNKVMTYLRIPYNKKIYRELIPFIKYHQPDIAHVHNVFPMLSPSVYVALKQCGLPVVQTLHNFRFLCPNGKFFVNRRICENCQSKGFFSAVIKGCVRDNRLTSALYAAAIAHAWKSGNLPNNIDQYIALNRFVAEKMIDSGIPKRKMSICGNFIASESPSIADKKSYILYIGRLSPEKGIFTLLQAVSSLKGVTLKIAGTGPDEKYLQQHTHTQHGSHVEFIGHVSGQNKQRLIAEAICTIIPSECYENFPMTALESLSLGTPVIASSIGGLPDIIQPGLTGLLFEPGNHEQLAKCIQTLIDTPNKSTVMAKQAITLTASKFSPEKHYQQLMKIYQAASQENTSPTNLEM